jgi:hypothetical protein
MILVLNVGRLFMLAWIAYALVLLFAPGLVHKPPAPMSGTIQALVAFALGHLLDRALSVARRRKAARASGD